MKRVRFQLGDATEVSVPMEDVDADRLMSQVRGMLEDGTSGSFTLNADNGLVLVPLHGVRFIQVQEVKT